jgi:hypothetical protein
MELFPSVSIPWSAYAENAYQGHSRRVGGVSDEGKIKKTVLKISSPRLVLFHSGATSSLAATFAIVIVFNTAVLVSVS